MGKSVYFYTYGCQMNVHDSEKMLGVMTQQGYAQAVDPEDADVIIFNTCAIREKAEQKFYSQLGRIKLLKKKRPDLKIAVAGCIAQSSKSKIFAKAPYVDQVIGPQNIHLIEKAVGMSGRPTLSDENLELALQDMDAVRGSTVKAWVSIMYGCNNFCSYCIVPFTRGREVSRPAENIIAEISDLRNSGYREVTLLGQNVNSYRAGTDFTGLLKAIDETGIDRVRFVTSHPRDFSDPLIFAMSELSSVCEHIHLPIQSGSDRILKLMNRGYTVDEYKSKVERLRAILPDISITTDIIAGFPGETDDDFQKTLDAVGEIRYDGIFAFKYSERNGTKASHMPGRLEEDVKSRRLNELFMIQESITSEINIKLEGTKQEVLVEGPSEGSPDLMSGRTRTNKIVNIASSGIKEGDIVDVVIEKAAMHSLSGRPIPK